jgi:hypothetical protein
MRKVLNSSPGCFHLLPLYGEELNW